MMMNKNKSSLLRLTKYLKVIPLALLLLTTNCVNAQRNEAQEKRTTIQDKIYLKVDKMPEFPGGATELMNYLEENIMYQAAPMKPMIEGRIIVNFVVNTDGSLSEVNIVRGIDPLLDKEAIRVISKMPNWEPGLLKDKPERVKYTMPVVFVVADKAPEFPGGIPALIRYLGDSIKYKYRGDEPGRVITNFIIHKDGSISSIKIARGNGSWQDEEAIRVIATMPNWIPGENEGKAVNVRYTLPIVFRLQR